MDTSYVLTAALGGLAFLSGVYLSRLHGREALRVYAYRSDVSLDGALYMRRWVLVHWFGTVRVHHILRADVERALHDHPFWFLSLVLWGWYYELRPCPIERAPGEPAALPAYVTRVAQHITLVTRRGIGSLAWRWAEDPHRVAKVSPGGCWTLVFSGRKYRPWGYWTRQGVGRAPTAARRPMTSRVLDLLRSHTVLSPSYSSASPLPPGAARPFPPPTVESPMHDRKFRFLHEPRPGNFFLDHRLTPEVRAMLCAMASRAPIGGIRARYEQLVHGVAESLLDERLAPMSPNRRAMWEREVRQHQELGEDESIDMSRVLKSSWYDAAEHRLCEYPLHPRVQKFFDEHVGRYGHSSPLELTGSPAVYTEGISWYTAWLLFDTPLCTGQEFSTRAVRHVDWPICREAYVEHVDWYETPSKSEITREFAPGPALLALHQDWLEVFEAEVEWWTEHLKDPENRAALGIADKEPFRPALDRARWALPGTIATGCAHTSHLRDRGRALQVGRAVADMDRASIQVWQDIVETYHAAVPGLAGLELSEAVAKGAQEGFALPTHLDLDVTASPGTSVHVSPLFCGTSVLRRYRARAYGSRTYLDQGYNSVRVDIDISCSLATARDWHRHRTLYPWSLSLAGPLSEAPQLSVHPGYEPRSELGIARTPELLQRSRELYVKYRKAGNTSKAMLCLPLGTAVIMSASGGLRDVVYMLELRKNAVGANFEYREQAASLLLQLGIQLGPSLARKIGLWPPRADSSER